MTIKESRNGNRCEMVRRSAGWEAGAKTGVSGAAGGGSGAGVLEKLSSEQE